MVVFLQDDYRRKTAVLFWRIGGVLARENGLTRGVFYTD
jgi:hypothetical protein